jgi:hypothetical protein
MGQVHVAGELFGTADGQLFGHDVPAIGALQSGQRPGKISAGAIHLIDHEDVRHPHRL